MARGKRWTDTENQLLLEMVKSGMTPQQIYDSDKLPNRTPQAIIKQLQRLNADLSRQKKIPLTRQIREAEIVDLETIIKRFTDAFNQICSLEESSKEDLERFRIIFSAARAYFDLYFRLEEFSEVKNRIERLEALVAQLGVTKGNQNPD